MQESRQVIRSQRSFDLAAAVLERLQLEGDDCLLALPSSEQDALFEHLQGTAEARLLDLGHAAAQRDEICANNVRLAEEALEGQGDIAAAAAFSALAHDRVDGTGDLALFERTLLRCTLE